MNRAPAFMYYAKDHIATLAALSLDERGAWITLVNHIWEHGGPITTDIAVRLVGKKQLESVRFLMRTKGNVITFDWIEETRKKQAQRSQINSLNGALGGRPKSRGTKEKSERFPFANQTLNEKKPFRAANANAKGNIQGVKEHAPAQPFTSIDYLVAWTNFEAMRKVKRRPLTSAATSMIFADLLAMGEKNAIASLNKSTRNGWVDVYPLNAAPKTNGPHVVKEAASGKAHTGTL